MGLLHGEPVQIWVGRGDPMSIGAPFEMLAAALAHGLGLLPGEPLEVQRAKLAARVATRVDPREARRVTEFLGELLSVPAEGEPSVQLETARKDPIQMGDQMRLAFEDWLAAETTERPVLVILEDLHWGDLPSVQFLDGALRNLADRPLMVLALARPEVHQLFPSLWVQRGVTQLRISELTRKAAKHLVRAVLGDEPPADSIERMVDQAAGNAFYLEEVIRMFAEPPAPSSSGSLRGSSRGLLPVSVLGMVQSRLEALSPPARRVLRAASVFGQVFWRSGVEKLLGEGGRSRDGSGSGATHEGPRQLDDWIDALVDGELITRRGEGALAEEEELAFRHALVREAAYAMLTERDRALGHLLAGEWLEERYARTIEGADAVAVSLAEHFKRGGDPGRAARWYRRAAEQAFEGNDFAAVVQRAERGLSCSEPMGDLGPLLLLQAEGQRWRGRHVEAEQFAEEALATLPRGSALWFHAAGELAVASSLRGNDARLRSVSELLRDVPRATEPPAAAAQTVAWSRAATWLLLHGEKALGDALVACIDAGNSPEALESDPSVHARVHYTHATKAMCEGDQGRYLTLSEAAADAFARAGILRSLYVQRRNAGIARAQLGDFAESERVLRGVHADADRLGIGALAAESQHWMAVAIARQGRPGEARTALSSAIDASVAQGWRWIEARARAFVTRLHLEAGRLEEAESEVQVATELVGKTPSVRAEVLSTRAEVLLARGLPQKALPLTDEAMSILRTLGGMEEGESFVRLMHAEALHACGDHGGARGAIVEARDRLLARADKLADRGLRTSMLERVPENARTIALAREWSKG
jgi:tetratricopeptide (TPR) repeat protein